MRVRCDLHIHSALSPCCDMDMTPNNIVNMSLIKGLQMIAITDHNHIGNVEAVIECAKDKPLVVIPGMELETSEEAHFVCLFRDLESAKAFQDWISGFTLPIQNKPDIFGLQAYFDTEDTILGYEDRLLVTALTCSVYDVMPKIAELDAVIIPAHVDKSAYSIISNLGFIPPDLDFHTVEISKNATYESITTKYSYLKNYNIISNSDAHYLWDIYEDENCLELEDISIDKLFAFLRNP